MNWWIDMNTDKMANYLEHDLGKDGRVRWGIVQKFMQKSYKPEHLNVIYRCLSWLQARWNKEYGPVVSVPLCQAAYRARSPDMALRILTSPWTRILPNTTAATWLLRVCAELQEEKLFKSPVEREMKPFPRESAVNDYVDPNAVEEEETKAASSYGGRHGQQEEKKAENTKKLDFGGHDLDASFQNVVQYVWDPRYNIRIDARLYALKAEFYAAKGGETQKVLENLKKFQEFLPNLSLLPYTKSNGQTVTPVAPVVDAILPTSLLASGEYQSAIDEITKLGSQAKEGPQKVRLLRVHLAALLALGKVQDAYAVLKNAGEELVNQHELMQTHLGVHDRVDSIRELYAKLETDAGFKISSDTKSYLQKLDSLLGERPAPPAAEAEAQAAPSEEAKQ